MQAEDIRWLHVELSSKCNAWCPACPRNKQGFGLIDNLVEQDLSTQRFEEIFHQLPNLDAVQLCGNYGDPIIASNILEVIELIQQKNVKIQIHTNGGLRNVSWWQELGSKLKNYPHDVWFGIDGLEGIHEIYRQGTSFKKVIENATAFIDAGGYASWQFIPYKHNEHQIKDSIRLSRKLKFSKFRLATLHRKQTIARHFKTGEYFELKPPTTLKPLIQIVKGIKVEPSNCMHVSQPSIYLSANGTLYPCCYFGLEAGPGYSVLHDLLNNDVDLNNQVCVKQCSR